MRTTHHFIVVTLLVVSACSGGEAQDHRTQPPSSDAEATFADSSASDAGTLEGECVVGEARPCNTGLAGLCATGEQRCIVKTDGTNGWKLCQPTLVPGEKPEACDGSEDVDCDGKLPAQDEDCAQAVDLCQNGMKDAGESDVDCGGTCGATCAAGKTCSDNTDCSDGSCFEGHCAIPPCENGKLDPGETDVDCGGSCTTLCDQGEGCAVDGDCSTGRCLEERCVTCAPNDPQLAGEGCDELGTLGMNGLRLVGNTLDLTCLKGAAFDDYPVPYDATIVLAGARFEGEACAYGERFEFLTVDLQRNGLRVTCSRMLFDDVFTTTHLLTVADATLSGGCALTEKAVRVWVAGPSRLALLCSKPVYNDANPIETTRYLDFTPVTVCR